MKKYPYILSLTITLSTFSASEVLISISDDDPNKKSNVVVSTDKNGNKDYIYIDKDSQIINSTIGTNININQSTPRTKEESIAFYNKRIIYYKSKIDSYHDKIDKYKEKIIDKPKYKERYQDKIERYFEKINSYKDKIAETNLKITALK
ncbi:MAG: Unknown protein [uncultured Sulfurovum sp.]|uniref:Uncharacterized protein n=1 Tax=uncultured Sulfurovum sp. TaxID=269237 RepID=A0A6S6SAY3_9BACT|nr:MAG: Unknown protein [uncultured Sulfurovum sp.]